ncbi:Fe-S cluster-binding ribosome biosynthesis protein [Boothiomyces macroporosus]|uniref:Translation initiation factor RLI1 n=1 Tax=Boothiomyces macroporosus TaxID=261099 RepID=A0AAD5UGD7_9FUNG|nr:Fe-S cluster-binding ribosome biosynthesis protein [Boothiomyces macroporosus]
MSDKLTRIAIVSTDKCKPKKCRQECKKGCPVVRMGKLCIEVSPNDKIAYISEELCIGCGICVKKCPFEAISIINLPTNLEKETTHRYSANSFKLHRLPVPRPGQVLGLVGTNGIGKSTALKILAGAQKPNLGRFADPPDWEEILKYFRGSELQNYFTKILEDNLKAIIKPQYVDNLPRAAKGEVGKLLNAKYDNGNMDFLLDILELEHVMDREIAVLSGGELQRFAIGLTACQKADIYMFDEPSSYLDVKQRLNAAKVIRSLLHATSYVIVVEHDLSVLDYLSDFVCVLYGMPSAYGVVTLPFSVREGINIFLDGKIPTENLRFRDESLTFRLAETADDYFANKDRKYEYPAMTKTQGNFTLEVAAGTFTDSEIIVMLGQNGTGKTTFIRLLAGITQADSEAQVPELRVSLKPQKIAPKFEGTVRMLLLKNIKGAFLDQQFQSDVVKPLQIENIIDQPVKTLSGGELQRVAIVLSLGKPADIYLIDEPSAYLDSEQRIIAAKVIKKFIMHSKKTAFIVEHDFIMATYLADRVIVYDGTPAVKARANSPESLLSGMNTFLKALEITFRRDPTNFRPRINKFESVKDKEQKLSGNYFFLEGDD